jgi:adenine-specific DNA-methyltransferase
LPSFFQLEISSEPVKIPGQTRKRQFLLPNSTPDSAPLIYPCHFSGLFVQWPKLASRKPNALRSCAETQSLLVPTGTYVLVKRFSSKEERRRVVASLFTHSCAPGPFIGFENHLNYIHAKGCPLNPILSKGLWLFLNSTLLDSYFRQFNGHTQVNATDLRNIPFPNKSQLMEMGKLVGNTTLSQEEIDSILESHLNHE